MTGDCRVRDVGELSLINYVISCSLKWLGQSGDASGHHTSRPNERQRSRAALEDAVGEQRVAKPEGRSIWLLNCKATMRAMPRQAQNKGARKAWERKDAELHPARTRAGRDWGRPGTRFRPCSPPKKLHFTPLCQRGRPTKSLCLGKNRSGCSIGITAAADVLIYQRKMCSKEMKNPGMSHRSRSRL